MRLATLITNTDDSAFAKARPLDDEKFRALISEVRPDWETESFWVCQNEFPGDLSNFDGVIITGSPASVNDPADWKDLLLTLICEIIDRRQPLFGACFGHQAIASALGVEIVRSDAWVHGLVEVRRVALAPWSGPRDPLHICGSHIEQVAGLPQGATRLFESPGCTVAGFALGEHVFTIQHHPEMTRDFIGDLVDEYEELVGPEVTKTARDSLRFAADRADFAHEMARFFECAARRS